MPGDKINQGSFTRSSFYIEDVTFLVEDELFKVPRTYFEHDSSIFRDMFQIPSSRHLEGRSDGLPIKLESIQKADFTALLTVMYPEQVQTMIGVPIPADITATRLSKRTKNPIQMGTKEWASVLKLSTLWEFRELRRQAIERLTVSQLLPIERVILGRTYCCKGLLQAGYEELTKRSERLSDEEKEQLGDRPPQQKFSNIQHSRR
ncbi:hypothetical protein HWV62_15253 [Athelia sp. TMB]|nr:hypothetical protein HWV62_15253 [Athelia sp. TMB]